MKRTFLGRLLLAQILLAQGARAVPVNQVFEALNSGKSTQLEGITFEGNLDLGKLTGFERTGATAQTQYLEGGFFCRRCTFGGDFTLEDPDKYLVFRKAFVCLECVFKGRVALPNSRFSSGLNVAGSQFEKVVNLSNIRVDTGANFEGVHFALESNFSLAVFGGDATFFKTRFGGKVNLQNARFLQDAVLRAAQFLQYADLSYLQVSGLTALGEARFTGRVDLSHATLSGRLELRGAAFAQGLDFQGSRVVLEADFASTQLGGPLNLARANFLSGKPDLSKAVKGPGFVLLEP